MDNPYLPGGMDNDFEAAEVWREGYEARKNIECEDCPDVNEAKAAALRSLLIMIGDNLTTAIKVRRIKDYLKEELAREDT